MTDRSQAPIGKSTILFSAVLAALFLLPSCTMLTPKPMLYRSEDYIVYKPAKEETAGFVAKQFLGDETKAWVLEDVNGKRLFNKGQVVVVPLKEEKRGGLKVDGIQTIPILCYHRFTEKVNSPLCLPPRAFKQQIEYLKKNGYKTISFEELSDFLDFKTAVPEKSVLITIDDGYRSVYDVAYPILKKHGFKATLFIYTDYIGSSKNALTWSQLREMKSDGFEVGSHSISHADLTQQREGESFVAYEARIDHEIVGSRKILDDHLKQDTKHFAFPYGRHNATVLRLCRQHGYRTAVSVDKGSNPFFADPLALRRNQIMKADMKNFVSRLKTFHPIPLN